MADPAKASTKYAKDVLVEPNWLVEHLDDPDLRVVEVDDKPECYLEGHIPGAISLDGRVDFQERGKRDLIGPESFAELLGSRGVGHDDLVVLYGDRNNWFAAFAYWCFRYYGHERVKLLNGPREQWIAEGHPMTRDVATRAPSTYAIGGPDKSIRALHEEVLAVLGGDHVIVDVRGQREYAGQVAVSAGDPDRAQRSGHIPGAVSIPWVLAVNEDGTFKPEDELRDLYGREGILSGRPVIAYCRIGERAALTWFVLHELLGIDDVKTYDGSWAEWANLTGAPVERAGS